MRVAEPERVGSDRPRAETTPGGDGTGEAVRVPDRDDELADLERSRVAELGGGEAARLRPQDGEVGERVGADDLDGELAPVHERGDPALAAPRRRARR